MIIRSMPTQKGKEDEYYELKVANFKKGYLKSILLLDNSIWQERYLSRALKILSRKIKHEGYLLKLLLLEYLTNRTAYSFDYGGLIAISASTLALSLIIIFLYTHPEWCFQIRKPPPAPPPSKIQQWITTYLRIKGKILYRTVTPVCILAHL